MSSTPQIDNELFASMTLIELEDGPNCSEKLRFFLEDES